MNLANVPGSASQAMEVLVYQSVEGAAKNLEMVRRYHRGITYLALFQFPVNAKGEISGIPDRTLIDLAHGYGIKVLLVLSNFAGKQFNPFIIRTLITHRDVEARLTSNLISLLNKYNLDGVNLDLENMFPEDRNLFSAFVTRLSAALKAANKLVTIAVPAKTKEELQAQWRGAFDYAAVGNPVDRVALMTYEEHWAGSEPGPVASSPWINGVLSFAVPRIEHSKLLLGIPLYGYDWPLEGGKGKSVTYRRAMQLVTKYGASIQWDEVMQSPHFTYTEDAVVHRVWFENVQSVAAKIAMARRYGLAGIAIWEMKLSFPEFWQYIIANLIVAKV